MARTCMCRVAMGHELAHLGMMNITQRSLLVGNAPACM